MSTTSRTVRIQIVEVGEKFAECAIVRDVRTRRKLHETADVPYGYGSNAARRAASWAEERGYAIAEEWE